MKRNRMDKSLIKHYNEQFNKQLAQAKTATASSLTITIPLTITDHEKAHLKIERIAYEKMCALVDTCDKEIAWHGTVTKTVANKGKKTEKATYTITDILMFPQEVTATTVQGIEKDYALWNANLPDTVVNTMRLHGHSHVNMGTTPSGIDTSYQEDMIETLEDFYIFMIINKRKDRWIRIVDVEDNITYETTDITVTIGNQDVLTWADKEIKKHLQTKTFATPNTKPASISTGITNYTGANTPKRPGKTYQQMALEQIERQKKQKEAEALDDDYSYFGQRHWYDRGYM